jgi:peptidoglycan/xylan/chitin deacetylase (PgdA/CDA1 family)
MNHAVAGAAAANHLQIVGWQVRSLDTSARTAAEVIARVMKHIEPGGIVLLHDGQQDHERTLAIARGLLDGLAAKGLEPVRVDQLGVETGGRESVSS